MAHYLSHAPHKPARGIYALLCMAHYLSPLGCSRLLWWHARTFIVSVPFYSLSQFSHFVLQIQRWESGSCTETAVSSFMQKELRMSMIHCSNIFSSNFVSPFFFKKSWWIFFIQHFNPGFFIFYFELMLQFLFIIFVHKLSSYDFFIFPFFHNLCSWLLFLYYKICSYIFLFIICSYILSAHTCILIDSNFCS